MTTRDGRITGRLRLEAHDPNGGPPARRSASNMVLRDGAALVARLFTGQGAGPIDSIRVGWGTEPLDIDGTALTPPPDAGLPEAALVTAVPADAFDLATDRDDLVRVAITATFSPTVDLRGVTEAGLLAGTTLYNQVVFDPVDLRREQDVTFFWEVDFPFGH